MKRKDYYAKLVFSRQNKKVTKLLSYGEMQEKLWLIEAMGTGGQTIDEIYNILVEALQSASEKQVTLAAIEAMGKTGRSSAVTHLEYQYSHSVDPDIKEAALAAIHVIKGGRT